MAGVNSNQVYLLGPDQSTTVGALYVAPIGTAKPTDARTALAGTWVSGGYISELMATSECTSAYRAKETYQTLRSVFSDRGERCLETCSVMCVIDNE